MNNITEEINSNWEQLEELQEKLGQKEAELHEKCMEYDRVKLENAQLRSDLRKYQDVLSELGSGVKKVSTDIPVQKHKAKREGISAETTKAIHGVTLKFIKIPKQQDEIELIEQSISLNNLLGHLNQNQIRAMADYMVMKNYSQGSTIVREGENGDFLYVIANGCVDVRKGGEHYGFMDSPQSFGELAILYNCPRTATIIAKTPVSLWALERKAYKRIIQQTDTDIFNEKIDFLKKFKDFAKLNVNHLTKLAAVLEEETFSENEVIIRQGAIGETFYLIKDGHAKVTEFKEDTKTEVTLTTLKTGEYFGEIALLQANPVRTATVTAITKIHLFTLDKDYFVKLIGPLSEIKQKLEKLPSNLSPFLNLVDPYKKIELENIHKIGIMGQGAYGTVHLVRIQGVEGLENKYLALKLLKKERIVKAHQQDHVLNEKIVLQACNSQFIIKLYKTFRDDKCVYMLIEPCMGGEVWTTMRDREKFSPETTRFIAACCLEAIDYLHKKEIIYRDLKPENLLFDKQGYVKLTDFGFAKKLGSGKLTWTFCGTNEYMAPEIILNQGHSFAVDLWCLGVLIYELLTGRPPFESADPRRLYNMILQGIETVNFPWTIQNAARNVIKSLCRIKAVDRLGYHKDGLDGIRKHKFFGSFNWSSLRERKYSPPFVPIVKDDTDLHNFDPNITDNKMNWEDIPEEFSGWDKDF